MFMCLFIYLSLFQSILSISLSIIKKSWQERDDNVGLKTNENITNYVKKKKGMVYLLKRKKEELTNKRWRHEIRRERERKC